MPPRGRTPGQRDGEVSTREIDREAFGGRAGGVNLDETEHAAA